MSFYEDFSFACNVSNICKNCFVWLLDLRYIRQYLMVGSAILAENALVSSQLDYWNAPFRGLSNFNKGKLQ